MAVTDAEVSTWLSRNPGASDEQIRSAMDYYRVTPDQLARASNMNTNEVTRRYNATGPVTAVTPPTVKSAGLSDTEVASWLRNNPNASDIQIRQAMDQYGVLPDQVARVTGLSPAEVQQRYGNVAPALYYQRAQMPTQAAGSASSGALSTNQQALLKALMDQQERDGITDEMRANASELYDRTQAYEGDALNDIATYTGGNSGIYNRFGADIENDVGTAVADARMGQTAALNTAARQAMRYGVNMPVSLSGVSSTQASQLASAANNTRNNAINNYRNLVGQGIGLKADTFRTGQAATADAMGRAEAASMAGRNMRIQDDSLDWAKQLDVTGMARGMPGASQGAYGVAVGAGNSAVQNQMAPGQALIGAMGQANNTTMQGQQIAMQGLNGVLNAQTSYANSVANSGDSMGSMLGGIGGLVGGLAKAGVFASDPRLKEGVVLVGRDQRTGLNLYEYSYVDDPEMRRYVGVMANEVEARFPDAVEVDGRGYLMVNYALLGIELKEVA